MEALAEVERFFEEKYGAEVDRDHYTLFGSIRAIAVGQVKMAQMRDAIPYFVHFRHLTLLDSIHTMAAVAL